MPETTTIVDEAKIAQVTGKTAKRSVRKDKKANGKEAPVRRGRPPKGKPDALVPDKDNMIRFELVIPNALFRGLCITAGLKLVDVKSHIVNILKDSK